jgi:lipopolysaccharide biosynthesis regulator YciM
MKYKVFLFFFLLLLCVLGYLVMSHLNPDDVKLYFGGNRPPLVMSVVDYVVIAFALGVLVSIVMGFFSDMRSAISGWKRRKTAKRTEELRELLEKAKSYDLRGDRDKAIEHLNRVVRRAPDLEESYLVLSDIYASMKEFDKAVGALSLAEANLGRREDIFLRKAKIYLAAKEPAKAEPMLKEVTAMDESHLEALCMLRDLYITRKGWDEAYATEVKVRKYIKTEDESRRLMGIRYERARLAFSEEDRYDHDDLIKELKDIIAEDKRFVPAYILLAEVYKKIGKTNEASRVYGRGYSKTGHTVFLSKTEGLYLDKGEPGVILKIYRRILDLSPKNHLIEFLYARLCLRLEMIDEAIDTLNSLSAEGIEFKGLHKAMAEAYVHRGEMEKAVAEFRKAWPAEHVYIPFSCDNCQAKKVEWMAFCDTCSRWSTINVRREDFLKAESVDTAELERRLYDNADWGEAI